MLREHYHLCNLKGKGNKEGSFFQAGTAKKPTNQKVSPLAPLSLSLPLFLSLSRSLTLQNGRLKLCLFNCPKTYNA